MLYCLVCAVRHYLSCDGFLFSVRYAVIILSETLARLFGSSVGQGRNVYL
jgi:hypothetical protein